jgi:hypothetical protein
MLETKSRYYEQVTSGQKLPGIKNFKIFSITKISLFLYADKDDEEIFLVNFDQKIIENKAENENESEKK